MRLFVRSKAHFIGAYKQSMMGRKQHLFFILCDKLILKWGIMDCLILLFINLGFLNISIIISLKPANYSFKQTLYHEKINPQFYY